jgi:hypothetical protein
MKARDAAIQGGLAALGLVAVYGTWQREPERSTGEVVVLDSGKGDVSKVRFEDGAKWVELERRPEGGESAVWLKLSAKPETKVPEREVRGNESAEKTYEKFTPLRGLRALGVLDAAKLKEFGLDAAKKKLEITAKGDKHTFMVANPPAGGSAPYFKDERDGRVYVVEGVISDLDSAAVRLVSRTMHAFKKTEWDGLKITAGKKSRDLVQTSPENQAQAKLAAAKTPDKPDDLAKNWHDKVWALSVVEVLGKGEKPAAGEPEVAVKVEYSWHGKNVGFVELGRVLPAAVASMPAHPAVDVYARTEHTAGWVKVPASADDLMKEAEKVAGE